MLNIKKLRKQSKSVRLAKNEHIKWAKERKRVEGIQLVQKVFTPCLIEEWEGKIKRAALDGERCVSIGLHFDNKKFNYAKLDELCYQMLFDLIKSHFKPQGFKCESKLVRSGFNCPSRILKIKW